MVAYMKVGGDAMKAVILATMFFFLTFVSLLCGSWWIRYDHVQNMVETNTKRGIAYAMVKGREHNRVEPDALMAYFQEYFQMNAIKGFQYSLTLNGYIDEPLFMKIRVEATEKRKVQNIKIRIEEAMIEEVKDEI